MKNTQNFTQLLKEVYVALANVAQLAGHHPANPKVSGLIHGQAHTIFSLQMTDRGDRYSLAECPTLVYRMWSGPQAMG